MSRLAPLRSLADHLAAGAPLPDRDRRQIADALARFLAGEEPSLDEALGLKPQGGQRSAQTVAILAERDRLLREAAAEFFSGLLVTQQARELHRRWTRYEASGWRRERALDVVPSSRLGTLEGRLWAILRLRDFVPCERTIRGALATSSGYSLPAPSPTFDAILDGDAPPCP